MKTLLQIENLHASVGEKEILRGINLEIKAGEVHAIMGPNGSGKSTLSAVLAGRDTFTVTEGSVTYDGRDLLALSPEERSWAGIFLGFQYPVEIPGVSNVNFMKAAVNEQRKQRGLEPLTAAQFLKLMREKLAYVEMDSSFSGRGAILDETDSGLDVDALRIVASGVNKLKHADNAFIVITHYQRLLDYIVPDVIHVLYKGRIIKTAGKELALEIEKKGYDWLIHESE